MPSVLQVKLNEYNSKIKIMSILCNKAASYNNKIKNICSFLIILISGCLAVITGILDENNINIKIPVIVLNSIIVVMISLDRSYKFSEKSANFHKYSQDYNRLSHDIDKVCNTEISNEFLNLIISLYDNITDNINEDFPSSLIDTMKKEYEEKQKTHLPLILNNSYDPLDIGDVSPMIRKSFKNDMDPKIRRERFLTRSNLSFHNSEGSLDIR